jgi:proline iminopeptidase
VTSATHLFGPAHVAKYRETRGEVGHIWKEGAPVLLLTTEGRKTGRPSTTPLIYARDGDDYVIGASKGGAPEDPGWYRNLVKSPDVGVQVMSDVFDAHARTAEGAERERLWKAVNEVWPHYDEYQQRTNRTIPVVVLERAAHR